MSVEKTYFVVLFDLEGTLIDFQWRVAEAAREALTALEKLGFDRAMFRGSDYAALFNQAVAASDMRGLSQEEVSQKVGKIYDRFDLDALNRWGARGDAIYVLQELRRRGIVTGLVTNVGQHATSSLLRRLGCDRLLETVVTRNHVQLLKPSGEGLLRAIADLKVDKSSVLFVGDSVNDVRAAQEAGIDVAVVTGGESTGEALRTYAPRFILDSLTEILPLT